MARIEIEESALDSIKAMAQRLQEERDELLTELQEVLVWAVTEKSALRPQEIKSIRAVIARCNSSPKVME